MRNFFQLTLGIICIFKSFLVAFARINIASNKDFTDFVFIRSPLNSFFIIELQPGISVQITGVPQEQLLILILVTFCRMVNN